MKFKVHSKFQPEGDQPEAIKKISESIISGNHEQTLLGVTGSGKTFTMANIIEKVQKPTLVIAHNKTLAAQLCSEFKEFFPENRVEFFVSYYDYYQPEAYIASSDTYIEKTSNINEEIERLRHSATASLSERKDVIIIASVSCIYALGDPKEYLDLGISLRVGDEKDRDNIVRRLIDIQYERSDIDFVRGTFRVRGDVVEIFPSNTFEKAIRVDFFGDVIDRISEIHTLTGEVLKEFSHVVVFPATHYATTKEKIDEAIPKIEADMRERVAFFKENEQYIEAERIEQRTMFDIEMMREIGYCSGIENYTTYFDGRKPGEPPFTLLDYFPKDEFLVMVDESHVMLPQVRAMYGGDHSRKRELVEYGFRLPASFDNRPLTFEEFEKRIPQAVYISATPSEYETERSSIIAEQVIRPTGLLDPEVEVLPAKDQIDSVLGEINKTVATGNRVLITTLTKKLAEHLTEYLESYGIKVRYMHSDIDTMERMEIIRDLRLGEFDVLVGINLLREGLDLPEVSLVAILDADKEGFLRSRTAFIQTIGRAARNDHGRVIMYGDKITKSMQEAIDITRNRRELQQKYNEEHGIIPTTIHKEIRNVLEISKKIDTELKGKELAIKIEQLEHEMKKAAEKLDFELAGQLRDALFELKGEKKKERKKGRFEKKVEDKIVIKGARENNLKNINLEIPRNKLVVMTGLSGSGKSSLAFDTIYAEGQRRYVESLSSYARQFLGQMDKPDVDSIEGLSPSISIDQKTTNNNPRSTVGTVTEIYDYLRLLYARIGKPHCPKCGKEITQQTIDQIVDAIMLDTDSRIQIMAPIVRGRKGEYSSLLEDLGKQGYVRIRVDGQIHEIGDELNLDKKKKHSIEVVIDRLVIREGITSRLTDSIEIALKLADNLVIINNADTNKDVLYSQNYACLDCGISLEELEPRMFSFNNPFGACEECSGLGVLTKIDPNIIVPSKELSINQGAIKVSGWNFGGDSFATVYFEALAKRFEFSLDVPYKDLSEEVKHIILYGTEEKMPIVFNSKSGSHSYNAKFEGVINSLERRYAETTSDAMKAHYHDYMSTSDCPKCRGNKLKPEALAVTVGGLNIMEFTGLSIKKSRAFLGELDLNEKDSIIAKSILKETRERLEFLNNVGLHYLTLSRSAGTLSGGEAQRIRLATQIGSGLVGVLYILDEPSIGLHQRDNAKLLATLDRLRDLGNTLIVVEHDEETIEKADFVVDIGPKAGEHGGEVIYAGDVAGLLKCKESITGQYLSGKKSIALPKERRVSDKFLEVIGASENNLKNIDVKFPLGVITCVTGVSGSGKSSLVNQILYKVLARDLNRAKTRPGKFKEIKGVENLDKIIAIDQSPIGRTPRSNPATYTGVFDKIRELFAGTPDAKMRGYKNGRFSFNVKGGRCEACKGDGIVKIEMHFLPDVYVPCDICHGKRYNRETLEVRFKGKNIHDILDMTVDEAVEFFDAIPSIKRKIQTLQEVGLGYIRLGQSSTSLSGGEAQRVKLATELSKRGTGKTVYILDEPTTGLHVDDVNKLVGILQRLCDGGNTVIVIEHNLDVIKTSDYIVDIGPEGGDDGGQVIACGTPEEVAKVKESYTGQFLKKILK